MSLDSPRQVRRREKLRALLGSDPGAQADLARLIRTPKTHLSAILAGRRGIGDALAAKLEAHYGKGPGWFDADAGAWPFSEELRAQVALLNGQELQTLERVMRAHLRMEDRSDSSINSTLDRAAESGAVTSATEESKATRTS